MTLSAATGGRPRNAKDRQRSRLVPRWLHLLRRCSQAVFLLLFAYLFLSTTVAFERTIPVDLFLRLDPLVGISASLASRALTSTFIWAVPLIVATFILGRFFCGWVCPLGASLDIVRLRSGAGLQPRVRTELRQVKYLLLVAILAAAALGNLTLLAFDPLSLLTRSVSLVVFPVIDQTFAATTETLFQLGVPISLVMQLESQLRSGLLPLHPAHYRFVALFLLLLAGVFALNLVAHRFWCRYLCPLGGLLALIGRWSRLKRRSDPCSGCGKCLEGCRMGAIGDSGRRVADSECVLCMECQKVCPRSAVKFGASSAGFRYDPTRRQLLLAAGAGAALVATAAVSPSKAEAYAYLIRPPGADQNFLSLCIRCGQCMKMCPTSGLQPGLFEEGLSGLWAPVLVPRIGPCDYPCNACGQVCPTGAIRTLDLPTKQGTVIGTAVIDRSRCIPWAEGMTCGVCEEVCQVPHKAIKYETVEVTDVYGSTREVKRPMVVPSDCIGCGICEYNCPLPGPSAIRVMTKG